jgi:exosome complex component RRP45
MRYNITPNCNKQLITAAVARNHRIDGRKRDEYRHLEIVFGKKYGSVLVAIGNTRVLATVTAEIAEPKVTRPSEGMLRISVDLSPMASPFYETNRLMDESVEIARLLERSIREARSFDTESLCLISGKKAWSLEANVVVFNTEGNVIESCSVALIAALSHFRRKDVTVTTGTEELIIHEFDEKNPIPLTIFHYPFCTKFCFFGPEFVVDPLESEESACEGYIVVGANAYRELTTVHISGKSSTSRDSILKCCNRAIERTKRLTDYLKKAIEADKKKRSDPELQHETGFTHHLKFAGAALLGSYQQIENIEPDEEEDEKTEEVIEEAENTKAYRFAHMDVDDDDDDEEPAASGERYVPPARKPGRWDDEIEEGEVRSMDQSSKDDDQVYDISDSSSEGDVMIMEPSEFAK